MPKPKYKGFYNRDNNAQQKSEFGRGKRLHAYRKTFTKIHDGIKEIIETVPKIRTRIFGEYVPSPSVEDETVIRNVVDICKGVMDQDFPLISSDDYPNTYTMTLRGDAFFFRTKDAVSFSWEYDHRALFDGEISIIFSLIFNEPRNPLMYKSFKAVIDALVEKGWVKYDLDAPREYRSRRSNQVRQQNIPKNTNVEDAFSLNSIGNTASVMIDGKVANCDDLRRHYSSANPDNLQIYNPYQAKPEPSDCPNFDFKGVNMGMMTCNPISDIAVNDSAVFDAVENEDGSPKTFDITTGKGISVDMGTMNDTLVINDHVEIKDEAFVTATADTSVSEATTNDSAMEEPTDPVDAADFVVENKTE